MIYLGLYTCRCNFFFISLVYYFWQKKRINSCAEFFPPKHVFYQKLQREKVEKSFSNELYNGAN
jgi:hypothetical protein